MTRGRKAHVVSIDFDRFDDAQTHDLLLRLAAETRRKPGDLAVLLLGRLLPAWDKARKRFSREQGVDEMTCIDPSVGGFLDKVSVLTTPRARRTPPPRQFRRNRAGLRLVPTT